MVDRVKGGLADWDEYNIMMECTPESGHCRSICTRSSVVNANPATVMGSLPASCNKNLRTDDQAFLFLLSLEMAPPPPPSKRSQISYNGYYFFILFSVWQVEVSLCKLAVRRRMEPVLTSPKEHNRLYYFCSMPSILRHTGI
jgi:hypothetical protein